MANAPRMLAGFDLTLDTPQVNKLVTQFHQFARKSAEGVLEMARVVKAASLLPTAEFYRFCERTRLKINSSTTRKLIIIGEKYGFLIAQADKLPANWTTVYAVARLANEQIQALIDQGVVNSHTVASELERALTARHSNPLARALSSAAAASAEKPAAAARARTAKRKRPSFTVELNADADTATLKALKRLIDKLATLKVKVTLSDEMVLAFET
jgi:hypothetical protein